MARYIKSFQNDAAIQAAVDDKSLGKPYVALDDQLHRIDWNTKSDTPDYSKMYLTIEALSGGTFYVRKANVGYSVNGGDWETTTGETALSLNQGHKVRFKGTDGGKSLFSGNTLAFNAYGNIESLEYGDDFEEVTSVKNVSGFAFCFSGCTGLFSAENLVLPAATLVNSCYMGMFGGCTNMKDAPAIPATALAEGCCSSMFIACKNYFSKKIRNITDKTRNVLIKLSNLTFGVYLVHASILSLLTSIIKHLSIHSFILEIIILYVGTIILSFIICYIISKIKYLNKLITL